MGATYHLGDEEHKPSGGMYAAIGQCAQERAHSPFEGVPLDNSGCIIHDGQGLALTRLEVKAVIAKMAEWAESGYLTGFCRYRVVGSYEDENPVNLTTIQEIWRLQYEVNTMGRLIEWWQRNKPLDKMTIL